ncbi:MAG: hypothetical protein ACYC6V_08980 [Bacillota bacterium]
MQNDRAQRRLGFALLFLVIAVTVVAMVTGTAGCRRSYTCIDCHTDRERLLADLKADPIKAPPKSTEQSGEG